MRRRRLEADRLVYLLAILAVVQVTILAFSADGPVAATAPVLGAGYQLGAVQSFSQDGDAKPLAEGGPKLVLVFHSECGHCRVVAPAWAEWLRESKGALSVVAVSREPVADAQAYADEHDWDVEVRSVREPDLGTAAFELIRRTPWVLALDGDGVVIASAHGSEVDSVAEALIQHLEAS